MPFDLLEPYSRFVRATFGLAQQAMVREQANPEHDVLFLLDEFARLGRFPPIEAGPSIMRGYRVRIWLLLQDLSQLKGLYRSWESFVANTVTQFFGTQDVGTCRYLSEPLGKSTMRIQTQSNSSNASGRGGEFHGTSRSEQWISRPLLTPDEVRLLPSDQLVVLAPSQPAFLLQRLDYRTDPALSDLADPHPKHGAAA